MSTEVAVDAATLVLSVCMFMACRPRSEARSEAETEVFRLIPGFLNQGDRVVYTDWSERRYPLNADTGGNAHQRAVQDAHLIRVVGRSPQGADIGKGLAEDAEFLGQAERKAQLGSARIVVFATQRVAGVGV